MNLSSVGHPIEHERFHLFSIAGAVQHSIDCVCFLCFVPLQGPTTPRNRTRRFQVDASFTPCSILFLLLAHILCSINWMWCGFRGFADEKYYKYSDVIRCKDGSKKFTRAQLNDDFCDCPDGSDEPGFSFHWLDFVVFLFIVSSSLIATFPANGEAAFLFYILRLCGFGYSWELLFG